MIVDRARTVLAKTAMWPRAFRLIWEAAPGWTAAWAVLLAVQGFLPLVPIQLSKRLVDGLVAAMKTGTPEALSSVLLLAALVAAAMLLSEGAAVATEWVRATQAEFVQDHIKSLVHNQSVAVDVAFYESSGYNDKLEQARYEAAGRPLALLEGVGSLVQNGITLLAMAAIVLPYGLWLVLVLLLGTLPSLYVAIASDRRYHEWWDRTTLDRRWAYYYDFALTDGVFVPELRLFGLGPRFREAYRDIRRKLRTERLSLLRWQGLSRLGATAAALLCAGVAMLWMVLRATRGFLTLGDLVLFYQAFQRGQGLLRTVLANLGRVYGDTLFLEDLFAFLDLKPQVVSPASPKPAPREIVLGVEFRDVTFRYPYSERPALRHFSLFIPAGKVVAIVGPNGAGKTSLLKLLCRFYDPEVGSIRIDGNDLREFAVPDVRRLVTVLCQSPVSYIATAGENIAYGDPERMDAKDAVEAAARAAGAHDFISTLPDGYDTRFGKSFGGIAASGGEYQRVATARTFFRDAPLIVLDEPTSALDSWSEAEWFARFRDLARGHTGVLITHRFTIAMRADVIHVMENGRIAESGTHHELIALGGRYAQSWNAQMRAALSETPYREAPDSDGVFAALRPSHLRAVGQ